jgi:protein-S-isoprenylcysteine O-methyltransferase Ste14
MSPETEQRGSPRPRLLMLLSVLLRLVADGPLAWMLLFLHFPRAGTGGLAAGVFNGALFLSFATTHSLLARPGPKKALADRVGTLYVRPLFVATSGLSLSALLCLWRPLAGSLWRAEGPLYWLLTALFVGTVGGLVWAASFVDYAQFLGVRPLRRSVHRRPPKAPTFSARGPYAYCRHPMYAFLLLALWTGPVMTMGRFQFAAMASLYLLAGTLHEERNLRQELGEVYDRYRAAVPMWIPRLPPWRRRVSFAEHDSS